jgi:hypothetical protein
MRTVRIVLLAATILGIAILSAVRFGGERRVRAQSGCSVQTLTGSYSFTFRGGYIGDQFGDVFDYSESGRLVADANGGFSGTETVSNDESISRGVQFNGPYTVNDDCTGTMTFKDNNGRTTANYDIVITGNGSKIEAIESDQTTNIAGTATQQFAPAAQ